MKTKTKTKIFKEVKVLIKELKAIYNRIDALMNETENTAEGMTEKEITSGKQDQLNSVADILTSARDYAELAYDDLEMIVYK